MMVPENGHFLSFYFGGECNFAYLKVLRFMAYYVMMSNWSYFINATRGIKFLTFGTWKSLLSCYPTIKHLSLKSYCFRNF